MQVTATGATHIKQTEVQTAATLYEKGLTTTGYEGYADVVVNGGERVSLTLDANVTNLTLEDEATVSTTAGAAVYHLTADKAASITGYGSVYQADINADGVSFASSVTVSGYTLGRGVTATIGGQSVSVSSTAGVEPASISVDLNDLSALGSGVNISLPSGKSVSSVTCDGATLSPSVAYNTSGSGIRLLTSYLGTLTRGSHTLVLTLSDGKRSSIAVTVTIPRPPRTREELVFDRYYKSSGFGT